MFTQQLFQVALQRQIPHLGRSQSHRLLEWTLDFGIDHSGLELIHKHLSGCCLFNLILKMMIIIL
jgi:hypothetical protein